MALAMEAADVTEAMVVVCCGGGCGGGGIGCTVEVVVVMGGWL